VPPKLGWRPAIVPGNALFRAARGDVIVWQSDDCVHVTPNATLAMLGAAGPGCFVIAACRLTPPHEQEVWGIHGQHNRKPIPMLAAFNRSDVYRIGGWDARFNDGAWYYDDWFSLCLQEHGVQPVWRDDIVCWHQSHASPRSDEDLAPLHARNRKIFDQLVAAGHFLSDSGPWELTE